MSHFSVAVFQRKDQDLDELLAPYSEELKVEPYIQYTRQEAIDYARKNAKMADKSDEECWQYMAEDYMSDSHGNLLSTYNPKSKYDYYVEGGRWSGMLRVHGKPVDSGRVRDVEFPFDKDTYNRSLRFWDVTVDHKPQRPGENFRSFYTEEYYREYYGDRETYARYMAQFSTYAVVTPDGEWHGKGEMGWWGMSSETGDEAKDWNEHYYERFIKTADPDWIVTIIDCHI